MHRQTIYITLSLDIYIYIYHPQGGEGGGGGRGGRGGKGGGRGEGTRILVLPSHRQPKSIGAGETSPPDLGAHLWVHTEGPPPAMWFRGVGSVWRGLRGGE